MKNNILKIWAGVNKNGFIAMHNAEPKRSGDKWISNCPVLNSVLYTQLFEMFQKSNFTWENEPEYFEIQLES